MFSSLFFLISWTSRDAPEKLPYCFLWNSNKLQTLPSYVLKRRCRSHSCTWMLLLFVKLLGMSALKVHKHLKSELPEASPAKKETAHKPSRSNTCVHMSKKWTHTHMYTGTRALTNQKHIVLGPGFPLKTTAVYANTDERQQQKPESWLLVAIRYRRTVRCISQMQRSFTRTFWIEQTHQQYFSESAKPSLLLNAPKELDLESAFTLF